MHAETAFEFLYTVISTGKLMLFSGATMTNELAKPAWKDCRVLGNVESEKSAMFVDTSRNVRACKSGPVESV